MPCKQGFYNPKPMQYECKICDLGMFCPFEAMETFNDCPSGYMCNNTQIGTTYWNHTGTVFNKAYPCPVGSYCPQGSLTAGPKCEPGNKCPAGSAIMEPCLPGTFQDRGGQDRCIDCPIGYFCFNSTSINPIVCTKGRVCDERGLISAVKLCPEGLVCIGGIASTNNTIEGLPPIKSVDEEEMRERFPFQLPELCPKGYFCKMGTEQRSSIAGDLTTPQECNIGEYNELEGQHVCKPCPAGFQCPRRGMAYREPCPEGFYRPFDPSTFNCIPCPEGTYGELKNEYSVYELENNLAKPGFTHVSNCTDCPPGVVCIGQNLTLQSFRGKIFFYFISIIENDETAWKYCPDGFICKSGTNLTSLNTNPCPKGKFCVFGMQSEADSLKCLAGKIK